MSLEHHRICEECLKSFTTGPMFNDHISQAHISKCDTCGVKFVGDSSLKSHIHVKYENYKTILGDAFDSESHKDKFHGSISNNLKTPAACLCGCFDG